MPLRQDHELINDIKRQRELHSAIRHLVIIANRLFAAEADIKAIKEHLKIDETETPEKAETV